MLLVSDIPTPNRKEPAMIKKAFAAVALAGAMTLLAASPSFAGELDERRPTLVVYDQDASVEQVFSDIEKRLNSDPLLQQAVLAGDSAVTAKLLSTDGTEVVAVGSTSDETVQTEAVRVTVRVTVCVRVWGTVYCGTVTVTLDL
jgi:hypothetical protein